MKGSYLEQLVEQYLENDGVHAPQYTDVWLWRDWPDRPENFTNKDNGIDLVAARTDGGLTAIQVKFYAPGYRIQKHDIDSFLSASSKKPFTNAVVVDTTEGDWSTNALEMLENRHVPVQRIGLSDFRHSNIDWSTYDLMAPTTPKLFDKKQLRPHQHKAVQAALKGFEANDRGKLIMACGTGKTFTSLKLAERIAEDLGHARILFMVPSLALMSQSLKEWSDETEQPMHAYAVCSDNKVGRVKDTDLTDVALHDLQIPATTDGARLIEAMNSRTLDEGMTVVFSTYQSIDAVRAAQQAGLPDFDLIICDEAHRTTGATLAGDGESHFVKIHDNHWISGTKRVYMTATPRIFNDNTKDAAREKDAVLCSMDDQSIYGPVFYRIGFGEAVEQKLLTDYKVLVLGVDETQVRTTFQDQLADSNSELNIDDIAKLVGVWNGLAKRRAGEFQDGFGQDWQPMRRAVAFNRSIKASQVIEAEFQDLTRLHLTDLTNDDPTDDLRVEVKHIDGGFNAVRRGERLDWLKEDADVILVDDRTAPRNANGSWPKKEQPTCRILTNARCLTEGVDVPSLDAVLFMNPRNSMVDVIQAVGRVMRNHVDAETGEVKKFGYIILPIAIPEGMSTSEALRDNNRYKVVWQVLQALRAHDERMDSSINQIELNNKAPESIIVDRIDLAPKKKDPVIDPSPSPDPDVEPGPGPVGPGTQETLTFPVEEWKDSVYAKIVDKCGNRMYWEDWSKDIASIAKKHIDLINDLLEDADPSHRIAFDGFVAGLRENLNPEIDDAQAVEMLAQHLVTKPVFDAMFADSNFTEHNPVSRAMQNILDKLGSNAVFEKESKGLEKFYESVRARVSKIDNAAAKQAIIVELYDNFFRNAFPRVADRLGIVFTPVPVVDYILRSADAALRLEFGKSLSDEGVSILEPFVGTGTFLTRLLQIGLIKPGDLHRKYTQEMFANEIVLLSYYIAAINVETVYSEVAAAAGAEAGYVPFDGIALTDTFQLNESDGQLEATGIFPENHARVIRQKNQDIRVIVMNPPYSAGQSSANDNNQNQAYPVLDASIAESYAKLSTGTNKNSLYDSYIRGIRWASNRITNDGVIAFVSNGSFIDGNTADGIRKTFAIEFSRIFVYNLRGNQRTSGEQSRKEGGKVFGSGSRTQVAICILIKKSAKTGPADIQYRDIGDYLTREQKLDILSMEQSLEGTDWEAITPNEHGDWVNHRDERYDAFQPIGDKTTKGKPSTPGIFENYSSGLKTNRDAWCYNFSRSAGEANVRRMLNTYNSEVTRYKESGLNLDDAGVLGFVDQDPLVISWDRSLRTELRRKRSLEFAPAALRGSAYRPFTRQVIYFAKELNNDQSQLPKLFPTASHPNLAIVMPQGGSAATFSVLMNDTVPALTPNGGNQVFSLYTYEPASAEAQGDLFAAADSDVVDGYVRKDNITDATLTAYRSFYEDPAISKEDIFYYVYGLLHSPAYKEQYRADLMKMLPRIPKVKDFWGFSKAGRALSDLHLNYETVEPYALDEIVQGEPIGDLFEFYRVNKLSFGARKDHSRITYNSRITLAGIPDEAFDYQVNGKSALEWIIDRYQVTTHKDSQITNDPNDYCREVGDPRYILDLIERIVTVSVETNRIVAALPELEILE
ncbi:type ISP restriction/modification enzyme [Arthrobacter sp. ov118]|uniref:DEAD/DEAH box helicase n=1 Tax=Arthrobacter sp. ov118 TaxID=1761747 RepID=UPI0008E4B8ED|nr:type ISP restriction/modification enzyme [Arthrobacter sp. ov118]SFT44778.1 Predicted helicase [Arthrobacter sp. ov118]